MHELGHVLGFYHEHQRPDRDEFIEIHYDNIPTELRTEFKKKNALSLGSQYDYGSIMHYKLTVFSKNGEKTMTPKLNYTGEIGQRKRLSRQDKIQANNYYQCVENGESVISR